MAKSLPPSKHDRLSRAIEQARAVSAAVGRDTAVIRTVNVRDAGRDVQRSVKFPKASNALRQHVSAVRAKAEPAPSVRLRTHLPVPATRPTAVRAPPVPKLRRPGPDPAAEAGTQAPSPIRNMVQLGDIVRHARRRQHLTQAELAHAAGTGRRFVSDVEAGKPTIEFERLMKLCRVLGVRLFAVEPDDDE